MSLTSEPTPPPLRTDAERNRTRILAAARQVFAERGLEASMNAIAKRAGVGIATLYRRFPCRERLIAQVFAERMEAYARAIETALADPDPWHGFCWYVEEVCAMQAADRGFGDVLTLSLPTSKAFEATRAEAYRAFDELVTRAQATGRLRPDFTHQDMVLVLMANAGVLNATGDAAPDAWRRLVGYLLDAFDATPGAVPLPPAPSNIALYRAMLKLGEERTAAP